jgi:hypothetical protein
VQWSVEMQLGDKTFAFMLAHEKRDNSGQQTGNLQDFVEEAQLDVLEIIGGGRTSVVRTRDLSATAIAGGLRIVLGDASSVRQLREARPATVTLIASGSAQPVRKVVITVEYQDSGTP